MKNWKVYKKYKKHRKNRKYKKQIKSNKIKRLLYIVKDSSGKVVLLVLEFIKRKKIMCYQLF